MKLSSVAVRGLQVGLVLAASVAACAAKKDNGDFSDTNGNGGGGGSGGASSGGDDNGGASSGGSGSGGGNGLFNDTSKDASIAIAFDAACATSTQTGQQQGLNAYMMLDYSGSMKMDNKWTGVTAAINSFVGEPSSGISVGMQYFGLPNTDADAGSILGDPHRRFLRPEHLRDAGHRDRALAGGREHDHPVARRATRTPTPPRPTGPALQGAIQHATTWSMAHPSDVTIVILATDGDPSECGSLTTTDSLLTQVETIAARGRRRDAEDPHLRHRRRNRDREPQRHREAGGTGSAFIVDTSMNVSTQFLAALNKIRGAALGCQYKIPVPQGGGKVNFGEVNVQFTTTGGEARWSSRRCPTRRSARPPATPGTTTTRPARPEILLCIDHVRHGQHRRRGRRAHRLPDRRHADQVSTTRRARAFRLQSSGFSQPIEDHSARTSSQASVHGLQSERMGRAIRESKNASPLESLSD